MSSSCISGGSRPYPYGLELDLQVIKSPSTSTWISSHSSSPSSTLSESSNSPIAVSTRKARTPRKRPNQTYNEAAALLSTAYPQIFSSKQLLLARPSKFTQPHSPFSGQFSSDDLLLHFPVLVAESSGFLLQEHIPKKPSFPFGPKVSVSSPCERPCQSPGENESRRDWNSNSSGFYIDECQEDFDAESMLDEEIDEGIDCIMGNLSTNANSDACCSTGQMHHGIISMCGYGFPMGFKGNLESGFGMRTTMGVNAMRNVDHQGESWPRFPIVDVSDIIPKFNKTTTSPAVVKKSKKKKKKKKKIEKLGDLKCSRGGVPIRWNSVVIPNPRTAKNEDTNFPSNSAPNEDSIIIPPQPQGYNSSKKLLLKLNYDEVLSAWSGRGWPFPDDGEIQGSESSSADDIHARLMQIDLFSENGGGVREASVLRYKEKRRTRLFSKKIRYQVRKVNADRRPRMKGRFVRRPNSPTSYQ